MPLLAFGLGAFLLSKQPVLAISIEEARGLPLGTLVSLQGAVTSYSGEFASSTFDQGFSLQDRTAGIYIATRDNPIIDLNQPVEVFGELADDGFGQLVVRPLSLAHISQLKGRRRVQPVPVSTGSVGENTEGLLVRMRAL